MRDDAAPSIIVGQPHNRIRGPPKFEGARLLKLLALEEKSGARHSVERLARHHRSAVHQRRDADRRFLNVSERGRREGHGVLRGNR
jgi:hypothetical protein